MPKDKTMKSKAENHENLRSWQGLRYTLNVSLHIERNCPNKYWLFPFIWPTKTSNNKPHVQKQIHYPIPHSGSSGHIPHVSEWGYHPSVKQIKNRDHPWFLSVPNPYLNESLVSDKSTSLRISEIQSLFFISTASSLVWVPFISLLGILSLVSCHQSCPTSILYPLLPK